MNDRIERQREVSLEGRKTEEWIVRLLNTSNLVKEKLLIDLCKKLPKQIKQRIKPLLEIPYGKFKEEIDADICVLCQKSWKLIAVISVKKSFRERGAQAAYWALKVKEYNKPFHYILATPDVNCELFNPTTPQNYRKWRVILSHEFEKVFIPSYKGKGACQLYEQGVGIK